MLEGDQSSEEEKRTEKGIRSTGVETGAWSKCYNFYLGPSVRATLGRLLMNKGLCKSWREPEAIRGESYIQERQMVQNWSVSDEFQENQKAEFLFFLTLNFLFCIGYSRLTMCCGRFR